MAALNLRSVRTNIENEYGKFKIFTPWANVEHRYYIEFYPPKVDVLDKSPERCLGIMTIYNPKTEKLSIKWIWDSRDWKNHYALSYTHNFVPIVNSMLSHIKEIEKECE